MIVIDDAKTKTMSLFHTQGSLSQEVARPSRLPVIQVPPLHLQRKSVKKRSNLEEAAIGLFWKATEALRTPYSVEEDFSGITACKMMQKKEGQRLLCEFLILEALNKGLRGQLTRPTPPPATSPTPEPQPERKRGRKTRE
ncbi:hypothetical protein AB205_0054130 [Aquarana catesbeiana]|uniref:Uncharacterized protein n=1 Tax=Aquarana catesbeiana TaxID=8400 RepID=A0A2G9Q1G6_AQUCT|nr:hypothetical protein AB205_0054130 [Aquarana catesbeiana]